MTSFTLQIFLMTDQKQYQLYIFRLCTDLTIANPVETDMINVIDADDSLERLGLLSWHIFCSVTSLLY